MQILLFLLLFLSELKAWLLLNWSYNNNIIMIHLSCWDQHMLTDWHDCFKFFPLFKLAPHIYQTEVTNWQTYIQNLGVRYIHTYFIYNTHNSYKKRSKRQNNLLSISFWLSWVYLCNTLSQNELGWYHFSMKWDQLWLKVLYTRLYSTQ